MIQKGKISDRLSGKQFNDSRSELNLTSLELTDSAVYLCASSQDTALHDQGPLRQKHSCPSSGSGSEHVDCLPSWPRPGRVDSLPQIFISWYVLMLTKIMQDKDYFNCLYIWWEVTCPGLIFPNCQTRNQNQGCPQYLCFLLPIF